MSEPSPRKDKYGKGARALELYDKGLTPAQIAERLGINPRTIHSLLNHMRKEREKVAE